MVWFTSPSDCSISAQLWLQFHLNFTRQLSEGVSGTYFENHGLVKLRFSIITYSGLLQSCLVRPTAVQTPSGYCRVWFWAYNPFLTWSYRTFLPHKELRYELKWKLFLNPCSLLMEPLPFAEEIDESKRSLRSCSSPNLMLIFHPIPAEALRQKTFKKRRKYRRVGDSVGARVD